jgi:alpha-N-arabinofuranosidase
MKLLVLIAIVGLLAQPLLAAEYHVSPKGDDANEGSTAKPFKTISAAAEVAQPGDVITVHAGTYRERINPPRGGESDSKRIVYQAAPGEKVVIKGSEVVTGWEKVQNDTWKLELSNDFFGDFNPYADLIDGDWFVPKDREHHTGAVYLDEHWLTESATKEEVLAPVGENPLWFGEVGEDQTTIWAQFKGVDPNESLVEINVRQAVFYPDKPGRNFITVRGFTMMHAATNWAPPTAEQIGLLGTHWSKGWIIENNDIRYSVCTGITLGKHGDEFDNTSENTAEGYVETIKRAHARGWTRENIGHHIVRNNRIAHCEQAGMVGSMGAAFCTVTGNEIHDIHVRRLFTGAEMAGIKFHAPIDTLISHNHIYRTCRGIWLDWMTQGTRVTRNVFHDNAPYEDLMVEVNHGPFLVDHNIMLSRVSLLDVSQGGAYAHNLFAGRFHVHPEMNRETPYHKPHSTEVVALRRTHGGDNRFYNNICVGHMGLSPYNKAAQEMFMKGNVFLKGAAPAEAEESPLVLKDFDPGIELSEDDGAVYFQMKLDPSWADQRSRSLVTTELLGEPQEVELPYVQADGSPYRLDTDFTHQKRNADNPFPGPFAKPAKEMIKVKVWPMERID